MSTGFKNQITGDAAIERSGKRKRHPAPRIEPVKVLYSKDSGLQAVMDMKVQNSRLAEFAFRGAIKPPLIEEQAQAVLKRFEERGFYFHHSIPMFGYIVDFWCPQAKLAIDIDSGYFFAGKRKAVKHRQVVLLSNGIKAIRVSNRSVRENPEILFLLVNEQLTKQ